jgi:hypothetical protein
MSRWSPPQLNGRRRLPRSAGTLVAVVRTMNLVRRHLFCGLAVACAALPIACAGHPITQTGDAGPTGQRPVDDGAAGGGGHIASPDGSSAPSDGSNICPPVDQWGNASFVEPNGFAVYVNNCLPAQDFGTAGAAGGADGGVDDGMDDASDASDAGSGSCASTNVPPTDPEALRVYHIVEPQLRTAVEAALGRFGCSTLTTYRGSVIAHDNSGTLPGMVDGAMNGTAVAYVDNVDQVGPLSCSTSATSARELVVVSPGTGLAIRFLQTPTDDTQTFASVITNVDSTPIGSSFLNGSSPWFGVNGTCAGCLPDFRTTTPAGFTLAQTTFTGTYCQGGGPMTVQASATLAHSGAVLSITDIEMIAPLFGVPLEDAGDADIHTLPGYLDEPTTAGCYQDCDRTTNYNVDWYIDRQDPRKFGLRNFRILSSSTTCCSGHTAERV